MNGCSFPIQRNFPPHATFCSSRILKIEAASYFETSVTECPFFYCGLYSIIVSATLYTTNTRPTACQKYAVLPISALSLLTYLLTYLLTCGPGSSVGIATDYGLDGPGSNPGGDEIFRPSRPALGPTQPPIQWRPGLSRG